MEASQDEGMKTEKPFLTHVAEFDGPRQSLWFLSGMDTGKKWPQAAF
jgi:hypothetical protein